MSAYTDLTKQPNRLLSFLDVVWKSSPRIRSDAARYFVFEAARASCQGLVTTWQGRDWADRWLITAKGLTLLTTKKKRKTS